VTRQDVFQEPGPSQGKGANEFVEHGYQAEVASPGGGPLEGDKWSDLRDASKYSADDLISLGSINSPEHTKLVAEPKPLTEVRVQHYDAVLAIGGQGPTYTFHQSPKAAGRSAERSASSAACGRSNAPCPLCSA
jgi:putative intracellular protease/amidase